MNLVHGSVIIHFCFVGDDESQVAWLQEKYLQLLDDRESKLFEGQVTHNIDQVRTQTMTVELDATRALHQAPCPYQVGDTLTIARVQEESITCEVESLVGEGATATVFKVTSNGKICALKVFKAENSLEHLCTEASLMLTANHPYSHLNVLRADFVWYEQRTHEMFFLLDFADGEDLQAWMDDEQLYAGTDDEQQKSFKKIIHELADGLQHLHRLGILHQDLKPDNILMTRSGRPLLADLGVANQGMIAEGKVQATLRGGTPVYASSKVRQLFFKVKALPVTERASYLQHNPVTHLDDFFAPVALVQHAPWGGDGGAEETAYGVQCLDNFLHSPNQTGYKADVIYFNWGLHDGPQLFNQPPANVTIPGQEGSAAVYAQELENITTRLVAHQKQSGGKLIFGITSPMICKEQADNDVQWLNEQAKQIMQKLGVQTVDMYGAVIGRCGKAPQQSCFGAKGCFCPHCASAGYEWLANSTIVPAIEEALLDLD
eukprot:g1878.t1